MAQKYVIGIDLGGTFIKGGVVSQGGEILSRSKKDSGAKKGLMQPVTNMLELIDELKEKRGSPPEAVGFGIPGAIFSEKGIVTKSPHFPDWINFDIRSSLNTKLPFSFVIDNDANMAAMGEGWLGAGKDYDHFCLLTLGTGIGGGLVLNGSVWKGVTGMAGEVGHIIVEPEGRACPCGSRGCLETYSSATGIIRTAKEHYYDEDAEKLRKKTNNDPEKINPELLCELANEGDNYSKNIYREMGKYLGIGFADLINILNLEMIIIGGGVLPAWEFFINDAIHQMKSGTYKIPGEKAQVVKAKCGNDAGLLGAACMAWEKVTSDK